MLIELNNTRAYRPIFDYLTDALENAYPDLVDPNLPDWNNNTDLMSWLSSL